MSAPAHTGLTDAEVADRRAQGQGNTLPPRSGRTAASIIKANVFTRINAILTVLLVIVLATGSWINAAFGLLIIVNSGIGIVQELRAKKTLDNLAVLGEAKPTVRRASGTHAVDPNSLGCCFAQGDHCQFNASGVAPDRQHLHGAVGVARRVDQERVLLVPDVEGRLHLVRC